MSASPAVAQETGSIRGTVVAATSGAPVVDVDLFLEGSGRRALSNRDGRFQFVGLPSGPHSVIAERVGFGTVRQTVTVVAGQTLDLRFRMEDEAISIPEVIVGLDAVKGKRWVGRFMPLDAENILAIEEAIRGAG